MGIIGAALEHYVDGSAACHGLFGVIGVCCHIDVLNGLDRRHIGLHGTIPGVNRIDALYTNCRCVVAGTVEGESHAFRRIVRPATELAGGRRGAGHEGHHAEVGAVRLRQFQQLFGGQFAMNIGAIRLQSRAGRSDLDPFGGGAHLKRGIHADHVVLVHQNILGHKRAKPISGNFYRVCAWRHAGDRIASGAVGRCRANVTRGRQRNTNGGIRHRRIRRIHDAADHRAVDDLCVCDRHREGKKSHCREVPD